MLENLDILADKVSVYHLDVLLLNRWLSLSVDGFFSGDELVFECVDTSIDSLDFELEAEVFKLNVWSSDLGKACSRLVGVDISDTETLAWDDSLGLVLEELMVLLVDKIEAKTVLFAISHVDWVKGEEVRVGSASNELIEDFGVIHSPARLKQWLVLAWQCHGGL